jgi:hypothetical protein
MTATAEDELLALKRGLAKARERAARNGLTLELGDNDAGPSWPGHRYASAHLMEGRNQVASAVQSYRASDGKEAALLSCLTRVYNRP